MTLVLSRWPTRSSTESLTFTDIDRGCDSLKHNCLTQSQNHGYCFLYREGCPKSDEVQKKIGLEALKNSRKDCPRWKRKCATKYPKHFTCRMYKRKCGPIDFPINNNSTNEGFSSRFNELIDDDSDRNDTKVSPKLLRLCSQWQRKCEEKYPRHFACRQFKRKCRSAQQQLHLNNELNTSTSTMNTTSNESTESNDDKDEGKILEQCQQWERICAKKDPEHHSCRQYRGKCRLADEHSNDSSTTKPLRQNTTKSIASKNATSTDIDSDIDNESEQLSDSIELDS
ncbi:hypothetical protein GCK32_008207 [Trichostrongylus colubriformis]|uniref:Uncharacterized protein n=1 Tax=Trichostrongylus colubriformis TaxID=6319 RepID=A0AAN8FUC2_TRICO